MRGGDIFGPCQDGLSLEWGGFGICLLECYGASNVTAGTLGLTNSTHTLRSKCGCCSQKMLGQEYWGAPVTYAVWVTEAGGS